MACIVFIDSSGDGYSIYSYVLAVMNKVIGWSQAVQCSFLMC